MNKYKVMNENEDFYPISDVDKIDVLQVQTEKEIINQRSELLIDDLTELSINGYKIIGFVTER